MKMIAAPLKLPKFESEPKTIKSIPTKITAKATKNNTVGNENIVCVECPRGADVSRLAWHSVQDQRTVSMQLMQTALPQLWHT